MEEHAAGAEKNLKLDSVDSLTMVDLESLPTSIDDFESWKTDGQFDPEKIARDGIIKSLDALAKVVMASQPHNAKAQCPFKGSLEACDALRTACMESRVHHGFSNPPSKKDIAGANSLLRSMKPFENPSLQDFARALMAVYTNPNSAIAWARSAWSYCTVATIGVSGTLPSRLSNEQVRERAIKIGFGHVIAGLAVYDASKDTTATLLACLRTCQFDFMYMMPGKLQEAVQEIALVAREFPGLAMQSSLAEVAQKQLARIHPLSLSDLKKEAFAQIKKHTKEPSGKDVRIKGAEQKILRTAEDKIRQTTEKLRHASDKEKAELYLQRATLYWIHGKCHKDDKTVNKLFRKSLKDFTEAKLRGEDCDFMLARIHMRLGNFEEALVSLDATNVHDYAMGGDSGIYYYHLAGTLFRLNRLAEARFAAATALTHLSTPSVREEAMVLLQAVQASQARQEADMLSLANMGKGFGLMGAKSCLVVSLKDMQSMSMLVERVHSHIQKGCDVMDETSCTEVLWEIALKLRVDSCECDSALGSGLLDLLADHYVNPEWRLLKEGPLYPMNAVEYSLSILFELCKYRQGCHAVADHPTLVKHIGVAVQIMQSLAARDPTNFTALQTKQALVDTFGRALSGLRNDPDRLRSLSAACSEHIAPYIAAIQGPGVKGFSNLPKSKTMFAKLLHASVQGSLPSRAWKPFYVMETDCYSMLQASPDKVKFERSCTSPTCSNPATKKCTGCRQATYCSVKCQRVDWKRHKPSCIPTKRPEAQSRIAGGH